MRLSVLKQIIPGPIRRLGRQSYFSTRDKLFKSRLKTIVGCQTSQKIVALTFDDGPNPVSTPQVLEVLAHYQVKATFFLLGRNVAAYPEIAHTIVQTGHAIGNHTFTHPYLPYCNPVRVARELRDCQRTIQEVTGVMPTIMRPPYGAQTIESFLTAWMMGYAIVCWSASGDDWQGDPASVVTERIMAEIQPGGIILLHDGWEPPADQPEWQPAYDLMQDRTPTIEALPCIIEPLQSQGYQFVTLPQMMQLGSPVKRSWFA